MEYLKEYEFKICGSIKIIHGVSIKNVYPIHFHTQHVLGLLEEGTREIHYKGEVRILKSGDIYLINPFEPHFCRKHTTAKHSFKTISFTFNEPYYFEDFVIKNVELLRLLRKFHAFSKENFSNSELEKQFKDILTIIKNSAFVNNDKIDFDKESVIINSAKSFIEKNCLKQIALREIADEVNLSEFYFNRLFYRFCRISPYAYYLICKMKESKKILQKTRSISKAAYEASYFDQSHYTREFKKIIGVTPGKFLKFN